MADRLKTTSYIANYTDVVILLKHYDDYIGWAIVSFLKDRDTTPRIMVYVSIPYRRQGLGTILVKKCENYIKRHNKKKAKVIPWDYRSYSFFKSLKFKSSKFQDVATKVLR